jgi:hypothetical protein
VEAGIANLVRGQHKSDPYTGIGQDSGGNGVQGMAVWVWFILNPTPIVGDDVE